MLRLGIEQYDYKAAYYLNEEEKEWAKHETSQFDKPILAICTKSKEIVKNWPKENWEKLVGSVMSKFSVIQLGDESEPIFSNVTRFAGNLSMRESAAILSHSDLFVGPDSLLMHIANGLEIPSVILFGGSRPVQCLAYDQNINLSSSPHCSPCLDSRWIRDL